MADYSLQDFWWNKPSRTESQLPALQLGVQMVQQKARLDLAERDLANDIARTSLMRDEMLAKQQIQMQLTAGNAAMAGAIAGVSDWTDDEQLSRVWATGAQYPFTVGGKAWLGAQHAHERAVSAKRLQEEADSRIAARQERGELGRLVEERRVLVADSTIDVNDARIAKYDRDIALEERRLAVSETNARLRGQEVQIKENRLNATGRWSAEDKIEFQNRARKASELMTDPEEADRVIQEIREDIELKRQARLPKAQRQGPGTNAPPAVVAPDNSARAEEIRNSFKDGKITKEQALQQLRELGFK